MSSYVNKKIVVVDVVNNDNGNTAVVKEDWELLIDQVAKAAPVDNPDVIPIYMMIIINIMIIDNQPSCECCPR